MFETTVERNINPEHLKDLAILLSSNPFGQYPFVTQILLYQYFWATGAVSSTPDGPEWHDNEGRKEYEYLLERVR